jgi:HSP20 family protein
MKNPVELFSGSRHPLKELQKKMDRLIDDMAAWPNRSLVNLPVTELPLSAVGCEAPRCNISEDAAHFYVKAEMPGVTKDNIKVELINKVLTISAAEKEAGKAEKETRCYTEFVAGPYYRSLVFPVSLDDKKIDAAYENGVLCLTLPKVEVSKAKQIAIH